MMQGILLDIDGNWAHFRKPETSNNPLSHDLIPKTALIGLIGAVLGVDRESMKPLFPQLSEDLLYGVQVNNAVKKQSWGFTYRSVSDAFAKTPKQMELIRDPDYTMLVALRNDRSDEVFDRFKNAVYNDETAFTPVLGLHNCPANLRFIQVGQVETIPSGDFETKGFVTLRHKPKPPAGTFRIGFERIPTFQNDDFWNLPERYEQIVYPSETRTKGNIIQASGLHYRFEDNSQWVLI